MFRAAPTVIARCLVRLLYDSWRYAMFPKTYGAFRGVYRTFDEAVAHAPSTKPIGYNQPELAEEYVATLKKKIESYDYPMIFWMRTFFSDGSKIFDFGGNVGTHFYSYSKYLEYPRDLSWTVCDVPAIVAAGERLAAIRGEKALCFTSSTTDANGSDVFIASGSAQYLDEPGITALLKGLTQPPMHILINRLPLYDGQPYVTLQNAGRVFYPQLVFNRGRYINGLEEIGYKLVDTWEDCIDSCSVPFHPGKSLRRYAGLYLRRVAPNPRN